MMGMLRSNKRDSCIDIKKCTNYVTVFSVIFCAVMLPMADSMENIRSARSLNSKSSDPFIIDSRSGDESFRVFWNVPTFQCHSHKLFFPEVSRKFGISQNDGDSFRGNEIAILYDPGNFPALLENGSQPGYFYRNGGIPQEGDLELHLGIFKDSLIQQIPEERFKGLGIIDFESWRPVFRQNFGKLTPYKDVSYDKERERHPLWPKSWIQKEAAKRFEEAGRKYVEQTMALAREIRPYASWGYYAYPYCFNMNSDSKKPKCSDDVKEENNRIQWLWDGTNTLLPSVYMGRKKLSSADRLQLVRGRIEEALRIQKRTNGDHPIYPYLWFKYNDDSSEFLTKDDLYKTIELMKSFGLPGVIIWGSTNDVNTKTKCLLLQDYVENVLGPVASQFIQGRHRIIEPETATENVINEFFDHGNNNQNKNIKTENTDSNSTYYYNHPDPNEAFKYEDELKNTSALEKQDKKFINIEAIEFDKIGKTVGEMLVYELTKDKEEILVNSEDDILKGKEEGKEELNDEETQNDDGEVSIMKIRTRIFTVRNDPKLFLYSSTFR